VNNKDVMEWIILSFDVKENFLWYNFFLPLYDLKIMGRPPLTFSDACIH